MGMDMGRVISRNGKWGEIGEVEKGWITFIVVMTTCVSK